MSAGECDGEITSHAKLLRYLYQRALISADVFGQSTLRRVTTKQRRRAALGRQLFQLIVADGAGVGQVEDPDFILLAQAVSLDPAAQGVNGYLRAHTNVGQTAAIDPAVQSVNDYIQAHASVGQTAAIDPAVQSVNDYIQAHANADKATAIDPAMAGMTGYLRAHGITLISR